MHGDWFYTTDYSIFGHEVNSREGSPPDNLTRWIITWSRDFAGKGIENMSRFVRAYTYLVVTSQVHARSSIVGNPAPAVDAQQVFKCTFKALINEGYSIDIDIEGYLGVIGHALSKVDFSVGTGMYMLPSDLNLNIRKTKGYDKKLLVINTDMNISSNRDINKKKLLMAPPDATKIVIPKTRYDNLKTFTKKHKDEKLATEMNYTVNCGGWVDCFSFLV